MCIGVFSSLSLSLFLSAVALPRHHQPATARGQLFLSVVQWKAHYSIDIAWQQWTHKCFDRRRRPHKESQGGDCREQARSGEGGPCSLAAARTVSSPPGARHRVAMCLFFFWFSFLFKKRHAYLFLLVRVNFALRCIHTASFWHWLSALCQDEEEVAGGEARTRLVTASSFFSFLLPSKAAHPPTQLSARRAPGNGEEHRNAAQT